MGFLKWMGHLIHGDRILITYTVDSKQQKFDESLSIMRVSEAQAYSMGYVRGVKIKDELKYSFFKTYVRFQPDIRPQPYVVEIDGQQVENLETASTLYDHWRSDSIEKFMAGMTTKKAMAPIDQKKLIMIVIIVAAACAGMWLLMK